MFQSQLGKVRYKKRIDGPRLVKVRKSNGIFLASPDHMKLKWGVNAFTNTTLFVLVWYTKQLSRST